MLREGWPVSHNYCKFFLYLFFCRLAEKQIQKKLTIVVKLRPPSRKHRIFHFSWFFQHKKVTSVFHSIQLVRMNMESSDLFNKKWFDEWKKEMKWKKQNKMKKMMTAPTNLIMWTYYGLVMALLLLCLLLSLLFCPFYVKIFLRKSKFKKKCFLAERLSPETVKLSPGTVP